jgi:ATP-binding protein involved in chromosome partitioning
MFMGEHVNVPVLGIVENMSWFTPAAHPDEQYFIFGRDGGKQLAETLGVELLGQIPLVAGICKGSDDGQPVVRMNDVSGVAFKNLATRVVEAIDRRNETLPPTEVVQTH